MNEEPNPVRTINRHAVISIGLAFLAMLSFCIGAAPLPLTALFCYPVSIFLGIGALWTGLIATHRIRQNDESGHTLAKISIGIGSLTILLVIIALVLAVVLWPYLIDFIQDIWNQLPLE